jgi:hypothetical protein
LASHRNAGLQPTPRAHAIFRQAAGSRIRRELLAVEDARRKRQLLDELQAECAAATTR